MENMVRKILATFLLTVPSVFAGQSLDSRISLGNGTRISEGGPNTISFSGLKSIGTNIVAYNWQLDESEIITGETVSYDFSRPDNDDIWTYMLSLKIENASGNHHTSYMRIEVGQNSLRYKPYQEKSKKQFYLADHLGNIRATVDDAAEIASQDAYYPFGKRMPNLSSENADGEARYKYNGKELDDEHGLNWLAYGARYFDPEIGRWHVVDPAEQFWSTYSYCLNKPILAIDKNGTVLNISLSLLQSPNAHTILEDPGMKALIGLFGVGGDLHDQFTVNIHYDDSNYSSGYTIIEINGENLREYSEEKTGEEWYWNFSEDGTYSLDVVLAAESENFSINKNTTPTHEASHVLYSVYTILRKELGNTTYDEEAKGSGILLRLGDKQHEICLPDGVLKGANNIDSYVEKIENLMNIDASKGEAFDALITGDEDEKYQ
jgi:RHS repeat-associated protein